MTWIEAFLLGLIQGATEFFPVSSSAHLKIAQLLLGIEDAHQVKLFELFCHLGTLTALFSVLKKDLFSLFFEEKKKLLSILIALLPLIPGYLFLRPFLNGVSSPQFLGLFLLLTGAILFVGDRFKEKQMDKKRIGHLLSIGGIQTLALIPGLSRSASTICCAKVLGWSARDAVRFSFLLSIPTIIGGSCLELFRLYYFHLSFNVPLNCCIVGFLTSFVVGMVMIRFSLRLLEKGVLKPFAWYCLFIGTLTLLYFNLYG